MKQHHFFISKSGELRLITIKIPSVPIKPAAGSIDNLAYPDLCREHQRSIESIFTDPLKSILVENQKDITDLFRNLKPETIYSLECNVEIKTGMSDGWQPTYYNPDNSGCESPAEPIELAHISFEPEQETKEESQDELWDEVQMLIDTYIDVTLELRTRFTITRK